MTKREKVSYMKIAASICNLGFTTEQMDLLVGLYELVSDKKGNTDLDSIVALDLSIKKNTVNYVRK